MTTLSSYIFLRGPQIFTNNGPIYRHVIQLFESLDGNFRLQKKKKNDDPDDVTLMEGLGYFPQIQGVTNI